jgi:ATP-dependent DNA helicase RecG
MSDYEYPSVSLSEQQGLNEGRKPYLHISADIAKVVSCEADYIRTRSQDDEFYSKLIIDYLSKFRTATREDIDKHLWNKLSDALDEEQKKKKIANLLTNLRRAGKIQNIEPKRIPKWQISKE